MITRESTGIWLILKHVRNQIENRLYSLKVQELYPNILNQVTGEVEDIVKILIWEEPRKRRVASVKEGGTQIRLKWITSILDYLKVPRSRQG